MPNRQAPVDPDAAPDKPEPASVPSWLVATGIAVGVLATVGGGVGGYAIMGWRVAEVEKKQEEQRAIIEALRAKQGGQDVVLAEIKVQMTNVSKSVEDLSTRQGETNALLREVVAHLPNEKR